MKPYRGERDEQRNGKALAEILAKCRLRNEKIELEEIVTGALVGVAVEVIPQFPFIRIDLTFKGRSRRVIGRRLPKD